MINASETDQYKFITKISILDAKAVFYPLSYVLQKRDIYFNEDLALIIKPLPEDIKYPGSAKLTDSGQLHDYKIDISINNQMASTQRQLENCARKVIVVLHYNQGKIILGCNEMPLQYLYSDDNTSNPSGDNGFSVTCRGNSYYLKVSL